jgi:PAT family beta-lactamase induction signal transducer AmpG
VVFFAFNVGIHIFITILHQSVKLYTEKRILIIGLLGFFSGLPLLLTASTLAFWLAQEGLDLTTIGLMSLTSLPYTLKFIWSPLVDRLHLPFITRRLGRRRGWLFLSQLLIVSMLLAISQVNPHQDINKLVMLCVILSFAAATQKIVMLTYQVERLGINQYGAGEAAGIFGYRMGMLLAGAGALYLSTYFSWQNVYFLMAMISALGLVTILCISEPNFKKSAEAEWQEANIQKYLHTHPRLTGWAATLLSWLYGAVVCPFAEFIRRKGWWLSLLVLVLYKASDHLMGHMNNIFYAELGFSKVDIANAAKIFGMCASMTGGFVGGLMISRLGIFKSLFYGGMIHAVSLFAHLVLYSVGYHPLMLYLTVGVEHFTGGMRLTALFAYQMTLCHSSYAATQLALCTSLVTLGRTIFSAAAGYLVTLLGWPTFFICAAFLSIPGLVLIVSIARQQGEPLFTFHNPTHKPTSQTA